MKQWNNNKKELHIISGGIEEHTSSIGDLRCCFADLVTPAGL